MRECSRQSSKEPRWWHSYGPVINAVNIVCRWKKQICITNKSSWCLVKKYVRHKSWRQSPTGKIWSVHHLKMSACTESEIGTKITCGLCGKKASTGYHLTIATSGKRVRDAEGNIVLGGYDWWHLNPAEALLGLEYYLMDEFKESIDWFVNDCCRAQFRRDCFDLGFKIDREKTSWSPRRSLNQHIQHIHRMRNHKKRRRWGMRSNYRNLPKTDFMKQVYRRLLDSGFIRYGRIKDGEICFVSTPAGRKAVQEVLDLCSTTHPDTENLTGKK